MKFRLKKTVSDRPSKARNIIASPREDKPTGLINGQVARSTEEWRVATALWQLGQEFQYQVPFFGGEYIIDFLVTTAAPVLPIEVIGLWWHKDRDEEETRRIRLESRLGVEIAYVVEDQLQSHEQAIQTVRALL